MNEREQPVNPVEDPPVQGQTNEPQELPGADPVLDRDDDHPPDGPISDRGGRDDLTPDKRLSKDLEGLEVDEPDPTFEEKLHGA